jgi:putative transposase
VRYAWIRDHAQAYSVRRMCHALKVGTSGYYDWIDRPPSEQALRHDKLKVAAAKSHLESEDIYGYRKVHQDFLEGEDLDLHCCRETVRCVMAELGLRSRRKRRFVRTTKADPKAQPAPNTLDREFAPDGPNQKWVADITYIPTREGWLYLAVVLDLYSRRVVGWATSKNIDADLVCAALRKALTARGATDGLLHHSDRGSQYTSGDFQDLLDRFGIACSMSRTGNCWDNAPMESFFAALKTEWVYHYGYRSRQEADQSLFWYIESFYNRKRRHASIGYVSPVDFEEANANVA